MNTNLSLSNYTERRDPYVIYDVTPAEAAVESAFLLLIGCVAFTANASLWLVVLTVRDLRTESNVLILCLSLADLLVSVIGAPFTLSAIFTSRWLFSSGVCTFVGYLNMLTFVSSVQSLGVISINRYFKICRPGKFLDIYTFRNVGFMFLGVWVYSGILSIPPLIGWASYDFLPLASICFCNWGQTPSYAIFMVLMCFCVPCFLMILCYVAIIKAFLRSRRTVQAFARSIKKPKPSSGLPSSQYSSNATVNGDVTGQGRKVPTTARPTAPSDQFTGGASSKSAVKVQTLSTISSHPLLEHASSADAVYRKENSVGEHSSDSNRSRHIEDIFLAKPTQSVERQPSTVENVNNNAKQKSPLPSILFNKSKSQRFTGRKVKLDKSRPVSDGFEWGTSKDNGEIMKPNGDNTLISGRDDTDRQRAFANLRSDGTVVYTLSTHAKSQRAKETSSKKWNDIEQSSHSVTRVPGDKQSLLKTLFMSSSSESLTFETDSPNGTKRKPLHGSSSSSDFSQARLVDVAMTSTDVNDVIHNDLLKNSTVENCHKTDGSILDDHCAESKSPNYADNSESKNTKDRNDSSDDVLNNDIINNSYPISDKSIHTQATNEFDNIRPPDNSPQMDGLSKELSKGQNSKREPATDFDRFSKAIGSKLSQHLNQDSVPNSKTLGNPSNSLTRNSDPSDRLSDSHSNQFVANNGVNMSSDPSQIGRSSHKQTGSSMALLVPSASSVYPYHSHTPSSASTSLGSSENVSSSSYNQIPTVTLRNNANDHNNINNQHNENSSRTSNLQRSFSPIRNSLRVSKSEEHLLLLSPKVKGETTIILSKPKWPPSPQPLSKRTRNLSVSSPSVLAPHKPKKAPRSRQAIQSQRRTREEFQLAASLLIVILIFIVCWFPYCISMFVSFTPNKSSHGLDMTSLLLGYMNSCVNPIVYGLMNKRFKNAYKHLYSKCLRCLPFVDKSRLKVGPWRNNVSNSVSSMA